MSNKALLAKADMVVADGLVVEVIASCGNMSLGMVEQFALCEPDVPQQGENRIVLRRRERIAALR